jgi:GNAT superfamily N-acetyltransferase
VAVQYPVASMLKNAIMAAPSARLHAACQLLARSMARTRSYLEMVRGEDEGQTERLLEHLFMLNLYFAEWNYPTGLHFLYGPGEALESFYMLVPSSQTHFPLWQTVYCAGEILWRFGPAATQRFISASLWFDQQCREIMEGREEYFIFQRMAVEPSKRGTGIGSRQLQQALAAADAQQLPVTLSTQEEGLVAFYGRA